MKLIVCSQFIEAIKCWVTFGVMHDGQTKYFAIAKCSARDHFSRRRGRQIVEGRLAILRDYYATMRVRPRLNDKTCVVLPGAKVDAVSFNVENRALGESVDVDVPEWMWKPSNNDKSPWRKK